jgi:hypothetical protein
MSAKGGAVAEAEHLPDKKTKSDTELAVDTFVDGILETHPNLDREEFREGIRARVQEYVPDEDEGAEDEGAEEEEEEEEEKRAGATVKAKGLAKQAAGAVVRDEETKAEGRIEREGGTAEGNRAYFRSLIEETNKRAADGA